MRTSMISRLRWLNLTYLSFGFVFPSVFFCSLSLSLSLSPPLSSPSFLLLPSSPSLSGQ